MWRRRVNGVDPELAWTAAVGCGGRDAAPARSNAPSPCRYMRHRAAPSAAGNLSTGPRRMTVSSSRSRAELAMSMTMPSTARPPTRTSRLKCSLSICRVVRTRASSSRHSMPPSGSSGAGASARRHVRSPRVESRVSRGSTMIGPFPSKAVNPESRTRSPGESADSKPAASTATQWPSCWTIRRSQEGS